MLTEGKYQLPEGTEEKVQTKLNELLKEFLLHLIADVDLNRDGQVNQADRDLALGNEGLKSQVAKAMSNNVASVLMGKVDQSVLLNSYLALSK